MMMKLTSTAGRGAWIWTLAGLLILVLASCAGEDTLPDSGNGDGDGGIECPVICDTDEDCCDEKRCLGGVCTLGRECPQGCNWECDKAAGEICNSATNLCEPGAPPSVCTEDCDCYSGESCLSGQCRPIGGDEVICTEENQAEKCEDDEVCIEGFCRPDLCSSREDCTGPACLVCKDGQCTTPPPVCQGDDDCCVEFKCNFGSCTPDGPCCRSDSDCLDPEFPRCIPDTCDCVVECFGDIDCPLPGCMCENFHCICPGCTPEECDQGEWCDIGDGLCKPGCDSNDDCTPPLTCNYPIHWCGEVDPCGGACTENQYCDEVTGQCVNLCQGPEGCPTNYDCDLVTQRCMCTDAACSTGFHCDPVSGACVHDTNDCNPADDQCPVGQHCDPGSRVCVPDSGPDDGAPCMSDADCGAGLLCDGNPLCIFCSIEDPSFSPTYTCRYECSLLSPQCQAGYECKMRRFIILEFRAVGLCIPI